MEVLLLKLWKSYKMEAEAEAAVAVVLVMKQKLGALRL